MSKFLNSSFGVFELVKEYSADSHIVIVFFKTTDKKQLEINMSGPTHKRKLSKEEMKAAYEIQSYILDGVSKNGYPIFEYDETDRAVKYIEERLASLL